MERGRGVMVASVGLALAGLAVVIGIVTRAGADPNRPLVERSLLVDAHRGDARSYRETARVVRTVSDGSTLVSEVQTWVRAAPPLLVQLSGGQLTVTTGGASWVCQRLATGPSCLRDAQAAPITSAAAPFLVALASGRYAAALAGARTIAGEAATCFSVRLRAGAAPVSGLGERVDTCFASDGIPLSSRYDHGDGVVDATTAERVDRGIPATDLEQLGRRFSDGSVPVLDGR